MDKNLLYRSIPKVDVLLEDEKIKQMIEVYGRDIVIDAIRVEMDSVSLLKNVIQKRKHENRFKI